MICRELEVRYVRGPAMHHDGRKPCRTSADTAAMVQPLVADTLREQFFAIYLDTRLRPIGFVRTVGVLDSVPVRPAELLGTGLLAAAKTLILVHNHPSGDVRPSPEDKRMTAQIVEAGRILGIQVLDHIILDGNGQHYSFADHGELP